MKWEESFKEGKEIILATCSKECVPNANIVISLGFINDKLLIADCQMNTTIKNLKENQTTCIISDYFRIRGNIEIFSSGKYFDICQKKSKGYKVKHAILIEIKEVYDLNKGKEIFP